MLSIEESIDLFETEEIGLYESANFTHDHPNYRGRIYKESSSVPKNPRVFESVVAKRTEFLLKSQLKSRTTQPIKVLCVDGGGSYTDGSTVVLDSTYLRAEGFSKPFAADCYLGVGVHELAHVLYTDFTRYIEVAQDIGDTAHIKLFKTVVNIIEDIRIEKLIHANYPTLAIPLSALSNYHLAEAEDLFAESAHEKIKGVSSDLSALFYLCRQDKLPRTSLWVAKEEFLRLCVEELTPFPTTFEEVLTAGSVIASAIYEENKESIEAHSSLFDELISALVNVLGDEFSPSTKRSAKNTYRPGESGQNASTLNNATFVEASPDREDYVSALTAVKPYISRIRKRFDFYDYHYVANSHSNPRGDLDEGKFPDALTGARNIYIKKERVVSKEFNVVLLVDLSGSMQGEEIAQARRTAVLLYEALKHNNSLKLFIYGHTADHRLNDGSVAPTAIYVFKEPGKKFNPHVLGGIQALANNRDGVAIESTVARVKSISNLNTLLITISDGSPAAVNYANGLAHTKSVVDALPSQKVFPFQIQIGDYGDPGAMFDKYLVLSDFSDLPKQLVRVLKKMTDKIIYAK